MNSSKDSKLSTHIGIECTIQVVIAEEAAVEENPRDGELANLMDAVDEARICHYDRGEQAEDQVHAGRVRRTQTTLR